MNDNSLKFLHIGEGAARRGIAVRAQSGAPPGLFWLGGYKSDMTGTKAVALAEWAAQAGRACVRFDYSGHGESEGVFTDGTIGRWLAESRAACASRRQARACRCRCGEFRRGRRFVTKLSSYCLIGSADFVALSISARGRFGGRSSYLKVAGRRVDKPTHSQGLRR